MLNITKNIQDNNQNYLQDVIWGSRLFVNAQFTSRFIYLLIRYREGECSLRNIFQYVHILRQQKKVKLYRELNAQLEEFITLERLLKNREVTVQDINVLNYVINNVLWHFTEEKNIC